MPTPGPYGEADRGEHENQRIAAALSRRPTAVRPPEHGDHRCARRLINSNSVRDDRGDECCLEYVRQRTSRQCEQDGAVRQERRSSGVGAIALPDDERNRASLSHRTPPIPALDRRTTSAERKHSRQRTGPRPRAPVGFSQPAARTMPGVRPDRRMPGNARDHTFARRTLRLSSVAHGDRRRRCALASACHPRGLVRTRSASRRPHRLRRVLSGRNADGLAFPKGAWHVDRIGAGENLLPKPSDRRFNWVVVGSRRSTQFEMPARGRCMAHGCARRRRGARA